VLLKAFEHKQNTHHCHVRMLQERVVMNRLFHTFGSGCDMTCNLNSLFSAAEPDFPAVHR
jgi:hypothetical protein